MLPSSSVWDLAELECLFWGQYFSSKVGLPSSKKGLHMVTQKWSRTLQQLDIANQLFTEEDLEIAMSHLAQATEGDTLRSLNLSGTRITSLALRYSVVISLNHTSPNTPLNYEPTLLRDNLQAYRTGHKSSFHIYKS